jgi:hypothetical protein
MRAAFGAVRGRLPALVLSQLVYGACITAGVLGVTLLLRELRLDMSSFVRVNTSMDYVQHTLLTRAISALIPDPGAPFTELYSYTRFVLYRNEVTAAAWRFVPYDSPAIAPLIYMGGAAGVVAIIAAETLLRLRAPAIMSRPRRKSLQGLRLGARAAFRHFGLVTACAWALRLVVFGVTIVFVTLPLILAQTLLVPNVALQLDTLWPYPVSTFLFAVAGALVGVFFIAFEVIYDARLYLLTQRRLPQMNVTAFERSSVQTAHGGG